MKILKNIVSLISIIVLLILFYALFTLGVLPIKFFIIIGIVLVLLNLLGIFLYNRKNKFLIVVGFIILFLGICINSVGIYYINNTNKLFGSLTEITEKNIYYVVVNKDSKYNELVDLNNKTIGAMKSDSKNYNKALDSIEKEVKLKDKEYDNMFLMFNNLLDNSLDSIIINSNNYDIACENNTNIKDNTKILKEISIEVLKQKEKEYKNSKGTFNIIISGIDTNGQIEKTSRSDVNILMTVNPNTHEILLTNTPRDMEVQLHGTTGITDKLTHAGMYGVDMTRQTLEDFLETDIEYYVRVNFDSLVKIIDVIGGVDVENDVTFNAGGRTFYKGTIHLDGKDALTYSRNRKGQVAGDYTRGEHQMLVVNAIINKITHSPELLTNYSELVNSISSVVQTNFSDTQMKKLVKQQLNDMNGWKVYNFSVTGSGYDYQETYSMPGYKLYVTHPEEPSRAYASKVINGMINGKEHDTIK